MLLLFAIKPAAVYGLVPPLPTASTSKPLEMPFTVQFVISTSTLSPIESRFLTVNRLFSPRRFILKPSLPTKSPGSEHPVKPAALLLAVTDCKLFNTTSVIVPPIAAPKPPPAQS